MTTSSVLAAAVALHDFTLAEVAAYCDADRTEIVRILSRSPGQVQRVDARGPGEQAGHAAFDEGAQRWRVTDARRLREIIAHGRTDATGHSAPRTAAPSTDRPALLRLLRAEETLFDCADEPSPDVRRIMAATAKNYLRQYVAAGNATKNWWEIELDAECCGGPALAREGTVNGPRLWVDVALANLTESEALGREVSTDFLIRTASEVCNLDDAMDRPRRRDLVDRFVDLAGDLTRLSVDDVPRAPAPARLLSALAWRRVRAQVEPDVERASHHVLSLLRSLEVGPPATDAGRCRLFRVRDHLPDGWNQITVYSDLLQILPSQYAWRPQDELVPGVLVEAVADSPAVSHLQACADALEANLIHAPWGSDSALIGIAAQVFEDLAATSGKLDRDVFPRCDQTRRDLLTLANVRTGPRAPRGATLARRSASADDAGQG